MINPTGIKTFTDYNTLNADPSVGADGGEFPHQDAYFYKPFDFTKQGDCVLDNLTGLTWETKTPANTGDTYTQLNTATYITQVNAAKLGGFSDWRLPTVRELMGIVDYGHFAPSIDAEYFPNTAPTYYWTSTLTEVPDGRSWSIEFGAGGVIINSGDHAFHVRLVRGVSAPIQYVDNGDNTVTDTTNGLMWVKTELGRFDWQTALKLSTTIRTAGHDDWRLPNVKELRSIIDEQASIWGYDRTVFPYVPYQSVYWTSSPALDLKHNFYIWTIISYGGNTVGNPPRYANYVRLVRNCATSAIPVPPPVVVPPVPVPEPTPEPAPQPAPAPTPPVPDPVPTGDFVTHSQLKSILLAMAASL